MPDNNLPTKMTSSPSESPTQILVIDDDEDILNLFSGFLRKQGYSVTSYLDPLKAVEEIHRRPQKYSLIMTDIRMPGISGIELIRRICKINHDIKVIIISAFELNGEDLKNIRYDNFIEKPVHMSYLVKSIEKILKK
ncbi:MAG TPA: response regulator [Nitrososphaeraceae archaeon]|nr:response regulator [Nitrososphaeraceae archaeon]